MSRWSLLQTLVWKDLQIEFRGRQFFWSSAALGVLLVFLLGMALDAAPHPPAAWAAGLLWICLFFSAAVTFNRHDAKDAELDAWAGLLLSPLDRSMLFYAKWVSSAIFLFFIDSVVATAFFVMVNAAGPHLVAVFGLVILVGTVGLSGVGTFVATLATHTTMRDVITPILLFPLCVPLFLAVIRLTLFSLTAAGSFPWIWGEVLIAYIVAFSVLPWLLFEPLMEV